MTIFLVSTWVVKPDKLGEFPIYGKKYLAWMKERQDLFKELKSYKYFSHMIGGGGYVGSYVEMWEFESLAELEKFSTRYGSDKEHMTKILPEFMTLVVPGTFSSYMWSPVEL